MEQALKQAKNALRADEVPVGAIVLDARTQVILSSAYNQTIHLNDPTAHAEILAIRKAGDKLRNYRLNNCLLVVTLEPCLMCLGAIVQARLQGIIFGAKDPKGGAIYSCCNYQRLTGLNHNFWVIDGVLADQSASLLRHFFQTKRKIKERYRSGRNGGDSKSLCPSNN